MGPPIHPSQRQILLLQTTHAVLVSQVPRSDTVSCRVACTLYTARCATWSQDTGNRGPAPRLRPQRWMQVPFCCALTPPKRQGWPCWYFRTSQSCNEMWEKIFRDAGRTVSAWTVTLPCVSSSVAQCLLLSGKPESEFTPVVFAMWPCGAAAALRWLQPRQDRCGCAWCCRECWGLSPARMRF